MKRILKLTLKKKWFDLKAKGLKPDEYRKDCKWSRSRLATKDGFREYDEIWYYNGAYFSDKLPCCMVKFDKIRFYSSDSIMPEHGEELVDGENYFVITDGIVLGVINWDDKGK